MTEYEKHKAKQIQEIILGVIASNIGSVNVSLMVKSAEAVARYVASLNQTEFRLLKKSLNIENTEQVTSDSRAFCLVTFIVYD